MNDCMVFNKVASKLRAFSAHWACVFLAVMVYPAVGRGARDRMVSRVSSFY